MIDVDPAAPEMEIEAESTGVTEARDPLVESAFQDAGRSVQAPVPAPSSLQRAMCRATSRDPRLYWQEFRWSLSGRIDRGLFRKAWELTLRRHDAFSLTLRHDPEVGMVFEKLGQPRVVWSDHGAGEALELGTGGDKIPPSSGDGIAVHHFSLLGGAGDSWELHWRSHHAWMDGRSRRIVLREVRSAYGRLEAGLDPFPEAAPSFLAALKSRRLLAEAPASLTFWNDQVAGNSSVTPLWFSLGHRPPAQAEKAAFRTRVRTTLPRDLEELLLRRSDELGVTINSIFQGLWAIFLSRTSSRDRVSFGAPRACRHVDGEDAKDVVGLLMNMVPVVVSVGDRETVADFLVGVRRTWLAMRPHETTPLLSMRGDETGEGHPALFESVLGYEERPCTLPVVGESAGWQVLDSHLEGWTDVPLVIQVIRGTVIDLDLAGCGKRFPSEALEGLSKRLVILARNLLEDSAVALGEVSLLHPEEASHRLACGGAGPAPASGSVMDRFDWMAEVHAGRTAIEMEERKLSYAELAAEAGKYSRALRASGVGAGDRVAVLMERTPETIVLFLAILKAGAVYLPLDSRYPAARVEQILKDAAPRLIVTRPGGLSGVETGSVAVVTLDHLAVAAGAAETEEALPSLSPDSPAYVMYSSGSTGEPKGIVIPHRGITRLVVEPDYVSLNPDTRILQLASLSFDAATFEIWGALLNGGCCVLYPGNVPDLRTLEETLAVKRVNTAFFTTSLFNLIARENPRLLAPLREVLVGGEALAPASMGKVYEELPDIVLSNVYGPTENTTFSSWYRIPRDHDFRLPIPLGRPIRGSSAHVVDHGGRLLPHGVAGELLLGGAGVGLGYLNKPELTAQRFSSGFDDSTGTYYHSGDLAFVRPDGLLEFVGRMDDQLKIRGFRVEPAEIEGALLRVPGISAAHVAAEETADGGKRIVAWIIAGSDLPGEADILRQLARLLPDYMIPAALVPVDELPLNLNGKMDRAALPSSVRTAAPGGRAVDDFTGTERPLAELWQEVLGHRPRGREAGFVASGGDSLGALSMMMKISKTFGVFLNHGEFMSDDSLQGIAALIARKTEAGEGSPKLRKFERRGDQSPTPIMRDFYAKRERERVREAKDLSTFMIVRGFMLRGAIDRGALECAVRFVVDENESLRTSLAEKDGDLVARVAPPGETLLGWDDLSGWAPSLAWAEALRIHDQECRSGISIFVHALVRVRLVRLEPATHLFVVSVHHMVFDGRSLQVFMSELSSRYREIIAGEMRQPQLREFDFWDDFLSADDWFRRVGRGDAFEQIQSLFNRFPDVSLPIEEEVPIKLGSPVCTRFWHLDESFAERIHQRCIAEEKTLLVFLLTAVKLLYFRYNRCGDNPMGTYVDRRFLDGAENIIGNFGGTCYFRERISDELTVSQALDVVMESVSRTSRLRHQTAWDLPGVVPLDPDFPRRQAACPRIVVEPGGEAIPDFGGVTVESLPRTQHANDHKMQIFLQNSRPRPVLKVMFPRALFQDPAMDRLVFNLHQILRTVVDRPDTLLRDLPDFHDRDAGLQPLDRHERESSVFQPFIRLGFEATHTIR
jgi:amino acid adenylation domain-containing protein